MGGSMVRRSAALAVLVCGISAIAATAPARAQTGPVIAVPSRPGIPIVINGWDASYAIVEGDWGLARPSIGITVFGGMPILPNPVYEPRRHYHPRTGRPPARGRKEIEPPPDRDLPESPERFSRFWSTFGDPGGDRYGDPRLRMPQFNPVDVPATIVDPETFSLEYPGEIFVPRRRLRRHGPPP
jgi:hypothetical protein